jgi:hypothetical protein
VRHAGHLQCHHALLSHVAHTHYGSHYSFRYFIIYHHAGNSATKAAQQFKVSPAWEPSAMAETMMWKLERYIKLKHTPAVL